MTWVLEQLDGVQLILLAVFAPFTYLTMYVPLRARADEQDEQLRQSAWLAALTWLEVAALWRLA